MKVIQLDQGTQRTLVDSRSMVEEAKAQLMQANRQHRLRIEQHLKARKDAVELKKGQSVELTDSGDAIIIR